MNKTGINEGRRNVFRTSLLTTLGIALPNLTFSSQRFDTIFDQNPAIPGHYPSIDPAIVNETVGKSHFDLDRVITLVEKRPELASAVWEWRYGDFESAVGAASHVGRRDIALYLMSKGAKPTLFTFAMLGNYEVIQSAIKANPGIQRNKGPHGISLLDHAYAGQRMKDKMSGDENSQLEKTIAFLESLKDAGSEKYDELTEEEMKVYLGDYRYGNKAKEGFTVGMNMRKMLSFGVLGESGGGLFNTAPNEFAYNGAPSVKITFEVKQGKALSLTVKDPDYTITARKVKE